MSESFQRARPEALGWGGYLPLGVRRSAALDQLAAALSARRSDLPVLVKRRGRPYVAGRVYVHRSTTRQTLTLAARVGRYGLIYYGSEYADIDTPEYGVCNLADDVLCGSYDDAESVGIHDANKLYLAVMRVRRALRTADKAYPAGRYANGKPSSRATLARRLARATGRPTIVHGARSLPIGILAVHPAARGRRLYLLYRYSSSRILTLNTTSIVDQALLRSCDLKLQRCDIIA